MRDVTNFYRGAASRFNIFLSLLVLIVAFASCSAQSKVMSLAPTDSVRPAPVAADVTNMQGSYADLVTRVAPAVVTIRSTERARAAQQFPFSDDPAFRQFFGDRMPQDQTPQRVQGVGSGVIVNSDGYILTNHHRSEERRVGKGC